MKNLIKKVVIITMVVLLSVACSNSNNSSNNSTNNTNSSEKKESFYENIMVKLFKNYLTYNFSNEKEYFSKNEYNTVEDLMKNAFSLDTWEDFKKQKDRYKKVKKNIDEIEKISKSKFFLQKGRYGEIDSIFFTPKENTGYDFCIVIVNSSVNLSSRIIKISIKDFVEKSSLYILHSDMKEGVDVKSLGLDQATTEKLLQAQNYKGL